MSDLEEKRSQTGTGSLDAHIDEKAAADFADDMKALDLAQGVSAYDFSCSQPLPDHLCSVQSAAEHFTLEEAKALIRENVEEHINDPNFDPALLKRARAALESADLSHDVARGLVEEIKLEAALMDDSPYLEVSLPPFRHLTVRHLAVPVSNGDI